MAAADDILTVTNKYGACLFNKRKYCGIGRENAGYRRFQLYIQRFRKAYSSGFLKFEIILTLPN